MKTTAKNLYKKIQEIETSQKEWVPKDFISIHKVKAAKSNITKVDVKISALSKKIIFYQNSTQTKESLQSLKDCEFCIEKLELKRESLKQKINEISNSSKSKHHAKLVIELDKMDKSEKIVDHDRKYIIDLKNVSKYYANKFLATKVIKDIDLQIEEGELVIITGPSGSGKTTLLNIISGMDTATFGQTVISDTNLINLNSTQLTKFRRDNVGYIFQQYGLLPNLTARENIEIGANLQKDKSKKINIDDLLKSIGMYEHRNKFPHELSGGQQQRVSIARSMAKNPRIIFGDEPTGAIDEEMSKQILQLFVDINRKFKTTVIIVTHNLSFIELGTYIIRVANGKIVECKKNTKQKNVSELKWFDTLKINTETL